MSEVLQMGPKAKSLKIQYFMQIIKLLKPNHSQKSFPEETTFCSKFYAFSIKAHEYTLSYIHLSETFCLPAAFLHILLEKHLQAWYWINKTCQNNVQC